jgi:hypothetical protein
MSFVCEPRPKKIYIYFFRVKIYFLHVLRDKPCQVCPPKLILRFSRLRTKRASLGANLTSNPSRVPSTRFAGGCLVGNGRYTKQERNMRFYSSSLKPFNNNNLSALTPLFLSFCRANSTNSSVTDALCQPVVKYENADIQKVQILKENKSKSGVYR